MMDNGASGYVSKMPLRKSFTAITTVRMGKTFLSFEASHSAKRQRSTGITRREKVLQLIAEGLTNAEAQRNFLSVSSL